MNYQTTLKASRYQKLDQIDLGQWNNIGFSQPLLDYKFLSIIEASKVNDLQHFYWLLNRSNNTVASRSNSYISTTDFASLESGMVPIISASIQSIKKIFPSFLKFSMLECGFFTTMGEGIETVESCDRRESIQAIANEMEDLAEEKKVNFLFFRDISLEHYDIYKDVLTPMGYLPTIGFSNALLELESKNLQDFLKKFNNKDRLKLKNSLLYKENFNIDCKIISDYEYLSKDLAMLWKNVSDNSTDYSREVLDEKFFRACSRILKDSSEVITFWHEGKLIAFMLNLFSTSDYFVLDWGVDYGFVHYRQANLYRAASLISVEQALKYGKTKVAFGITNYVPKKLIGAVMHPLIYFVKHRSNGVFTYALSKSLNKQIVKPNHSSFFAKYPHLCRYEKLDEFIHEEQSYFKGESVLSRTIIKLISGLI
jgi:8-amino-7-oxononanoate synthase